MPSDILTPGAPDVLYVVDLSAWHHRAFHHREGVAGMFAYSAGYLVGLLCAQDPRYLVAALDPRDRAVPLRRKARFPAYKSSRVRKGDDFYGQCDRAEDLWRQHRIPCLSTPGYEADDVIASVVAQARAEGLRVVIVSEDKDHAQLITSTCPEVVQWKQERYPGGGGVWNDAPAPNGPDVVKLPAFDEAAALARFGVPPTLLRDWLALVGDNSDDLPGVKGIGDVVAARLLQRRGSLEGVITEALDLARAAPVPAAAAKAAGYPGPSALAKMVAGIESARLSYDLAGLELAPIELDLAAASVGGFDVGAVRGVYEEFGFVRLAESVSTATNAKRPWVAAPF